jgi:CRP/FNR family transcriptional regulator
MEGLSGSASGTKTFSDAVTTAARSDTRENARTGSSMFLTCCAPTGLAMGERHPFSADAIEPVTACQFRRTDFSALVDAKPHLLRRLHEFATHELTLAQDQMMQLGRRTAEEKLVTFLLATRDRWTKLGPVSVTVRLPMSRQDIADFLGLTIETVSRTFTKLVKDKTILIVPDGVRLMNLERMAALAAA